ncbi:PREDICTED: uncharacterized protein LOC108763312 [Trachymyrmex cornetzi]|uniref:uncharacterized protein LOC108763312 n=1 Tax=Trachymyrmex cornetzi TaxID=471704 RepID=UPI00084F47E4|nr:PREDICTED: uncharacterized protein LOC108763312 [Trachymyrmex cornetzi]
MQEVWSIQLGWDDPVPSTIASKWTSFVSDLQNLTSVSFPRWIGLSSDRTFEIHGFADASPHAFAAVVYTRLTSSNGTIHTKLIGSKTKVAPLKRLTIPRFELAGAVLLTKLVKHILEILSQNHIPIYLRTDSSVTLTWISNHPSRWKDFVHNRVCFIQESLPQAQWRFVAGQENPADLATRGLTVSQLLDKEIWWSGPVWLTEPSSDWPTNLIATESTENLEEKPIKVVTIRVQPFEYWNLLSRYSSLKKLLRITAVCRRVIDRFRKAPKSSLTHPLTTTELDSAKQFWVKTVQSAVFSKELELISSGKHFQPSHPFSRLTPFKDADGILRVGGRLQESSLGMEARHPAISYRSVLHSLH